MVGVKKSRAARSLLRYHANKPNRPKLSRTGTGLAASARAGAGVFMKHAASRELYAYWQELRGRRPAPTRAEIEPGAIRRILSEAFILALDRASGYPFRLAGTRVCALFGRELKGETFLDLWDEPGRRTVGDW